jgi:DNA-binding CsgD family transcriptional regulator
MTTNSLQTAGDAELLSRVDRLTDHDLRVLIAVAGREHSRKGLPAALGMTSSSVANAMGTVRRKLGVPKRSDLADFVRDQPPLVLALSHWTATGTP